jgi:NADPH2:quinone reductase
VGEPGPGEIRIRHHAVGLNFIDVYHRTGVYPPPPCPMSRAAAAGTRRCGERRR